MSTSAVYIAIALTTLLVVAVLTLLLGRGPNATTRPTPLAAFAFSLVVMGMVFGENRVVGYSFFALGVALAVVDAVRREPPRSGTGAG
jgi:prepilin signal peptidase PulO-like enzyme (type II secretory pathway)